MSPARQRDAAIAVVCAMTIISCLQGCGQQAPVEDAAPLPEIDLAPHLLHDEDEIAAYVDAFPFDEHQPHHMPARCRQMRAFFACWRNRLASPYVGRFWIEGPPLDVIKRRHVAGVVWEPEVVAALEDHVRPGTVALDVGAYIGTHALLMGRLVGSPRQGLRLRAAAQDLPPARPQHRAERPRGRRRAAALRPRRGHAHRGDEPGDGHHRRRRERRQRRRSRGTAHVGQLRLQARLAAQDRRRRLREGSARRRGRVADYRPTGGSDRDSRRRVLPRRADDGPAAANRRQPSNWRKSTPCGA